MNEEQVRKMISEAFCQLATEFDSAYEGGEIEARALDAVSRVVNLVARELVKAVSMPEYLRGDE